MLSPALTENATLDGVIRAAALVVVALLLAACAGGESQEAPDASPGAPILATPRPGTTPFPGATAEPNGESQAMRPSMQLRGVYKLPEYIETEEVVDLPERPAPAFGAWDGGSVVIYDTQQGEAFDFGPGNLGKPAFGKEHLVFTSEDEVFVVDLATMEKRFLARGWHAYFLGDSHVVINPGDNTFFAVDVITGKRLDLKDLRAPVLQSMVSQRWGGTFLAKWFHDRFAIRTVENPREVCRLSGVEQRTCLAEAGSRWVVEDVWLDEMRLAFEASKVEPAGPVEIVMATTPVCYEGIWLVSCFEVLAELESESPPPGGTVAVEGFTNIFLVDLTDGAATYVATATYNAVSGRWPMNWPLVANQDYVAWTESFCGDPRGLTRIYNRETGTITELTTSEWLAMADGRLGLGEHGATSLIDPATLEYLSVLPEMTGVRWSSDLRYAAVGQDLGGRGPCD